MTPPLYTTEILRLAASIPYLGPLDRPQGRAELRSPTCGSTVAVDVILDGARKVSAIGQEMQACAFGQASAALMGGHAIGATLEEVDAALADLSAWLDGTREDPGNWPGLEALAPARSRTARHAAILLPFRALAKAVRKAGAKA